MPPLPFLATIGVLLCATSCQAGTVTAYLNGNSLTSGLPGISYNYNGTSGITYAGSFNWSPNSPSAGSGLSYCIQIDAFIIPGYQYTYQTAALAPSASINAAALVNIEKLWGGFYNQTLNSATNAAAFQVAIWQLEYGAGFQASGTDSASVAAVALANTLVLQATGQSKNPDAPNFTTPNTNLATWTLGYATVDGTNYYGAQDQLIDPPPAPSPEPSSLCLCAVGVATLVAARYRRRKVLSPTAKTS